MIRNNSFHFRALSSLGLVVLLLTIVLESADAAAGISPIVACETFTLLCGPSQDVCFTIEYYTPSPAATIDANGTNATFYEGDYVNIYEIVQNVDEGTDTQATPLTDDQKVARIVITRDVDNVCTSVQINDEFCASCSTCEETDADGGPLFSADCTNVTNGKEVFCEGLEPLFYPLQLVESNGTDTAFPEPGNMTMVPETTTTAPVAAPTFPEPGNMTMVPETTTTAPVAAPTSINAASTAIRFDGNGKRMGALVGAVGLLLMTI
jgi:hypothetical protein